MGDRKKIVYVERVVFVQRKRRRIQPTARNLDVGDFLKDEQQNFLRELMDKQATTKDTRLSVKYIIRKLSEKCGVNLKEKDMRDILRELGYEWRKLLPGDIRTNATNPDIVERRNLLLPLLYACHFHPKVMVWNHDESNFHVNDFARYGWVSMIDKDARYKSWIKKNTAKSDGKRNMVSGFINRQHGLLCDENGVHIGYSEFDFIQNMDTVLEEFEMAAMRVNELYPDYIHVFQTDSPNNHCMWMEGAVNPNQIPACEDGANRAPDNVYGTHGLTWILTNKFHQDTTNMSVRDMRQYLWRQDVMKEQRMRLESLLNMHDCVLVFNVQAHPFLAPIELLWRDMKYDYRTNSEKSMPGLRGKLDGWLDNPEDPVDRDIVESYYTASMGCLEYYLSGGVQFEHEREIRKASGGGMDHLVTDATQTKTARLNHLYKQVPRLKPGAVHDYKLCLLHEAIESYAHKLNLVRKSKILEKADFGL